MADDLYVRYQTADAKYRAHRGSCTTCTDAVRCGAGGRLYESFARLQDAYLTRQQQRR
ncbi:hypothetical protein ACIQNG_35420 [Streptomyces sp. NPDC091377]|uniref:hypothetical protein n=1 Tax=Streptomyces sp. NPDC091377 TaxID=3365995 RepID=UPI00380051BD